MGRIEELSYGTDFGFVKIFSKTILCALLVLSINTMDLYAQCFEPPDGYTLYWSSNNQYVGPDTAGFVSSSVDTAVYWSIIDDGGGIVSFVPPLSANAEGITSTLRLSGTGNITIRGRLRGTNQGPCPTGLIY